MNKNVLNIIFSFLLSTGFCYSLFANESNLLNELYQSGNTEKTADIFKAIIRSPSKYANDILNDLQECSKNPSTTPNSLLYLAAYFRDARYIDPLIKIINDKTYSCDNCIYECPIIFALSVYGVFTPYNIPTDLDESLTPIYDLYSTIKKIKSLIPESEKASDYIQGPGIDEFIREAESMTTAALINAAGPSNTDKKRRLAAAYVLRYKVIQDKYLPDLYSLAVSETVDASAQYRSSIYWAIYKAEKKNILNQKNHLIDP